jgi:hypothetical protein
MLRPGIGVEIRTIIAEGEEELPIVPSSSSSFAVPSEGDTHASIHDLVFTEFCKSGSITPPTQGEIIPIIYTEEGLKELNMRLRERLNIQKEKVGSSEEDLVELINCSRRLLELSHIQHGNFAFEIEYQKNINPRFLNTIELPEGPTVTRFGINPVALKKAATDENYIIPSNRLHLVEEELFNRALEKLDDVSLPSANNTVVVDILARLGARLKIIEGELLPETHAIVLWKPVEDYIVLIDPSRREFSEHIAGALNLKFDGMPKFIVAALLGSVIYASQGKETGYSEYSNPEPKPRDCIDIAVKLAFEISERELESSDKLEIKDKLAMLEQVVSQVSNKAVLNDAVVNLDNTTLRELQSSNRKDRIDAVNYLSKNSSIISSNKRLFSRASLNIIREKVDEEKTRRALRTAERETSAALARARKGKEKD